jgi:two-component system sensor histidine kinase YesM
MKKKKGSTIKRRLNTLVMVCMVPMAAVVIYLIILLNQFSQRYDRIVENITLANEYNITFKEDLDYLMYIIVVNSDRAGELVDTQQPYVMIDEARSSFQNLYEMADSDSTRNQLQRILKSLNTLEDRVEDIEKDALVSGSYDTNMERLDLDIRVMTDLIQEQIQKYIYYETTNLEVLRSGIRLDVDNSIRAAIVGLTLILIGALAINRRIMDGITKPISELCDVAKSAGSGDFEVRAREEQQDEELAVLSTSFNQMVEQIGDLVEDIRVEQLNLRATELKLLQAQINPHFLYNTLDAIIWLAESGQKDQVVMMVTALSDFFRTTLSKGKDYITVKEEETHIRSYLQIQHFRYRDILEYEIQIPEELYQYEILKLTLQPLVENALYHGIKNKRGKGQILVTGEQIGEELVFCVRDNGKGMGSKRLEEVRRLIDGDANPEETSGFGLFNVAQRIRLNYGVEYGLELSSVYGEWTEAKVRIPAVPAVKN